MRRSQAPSMKVAGGQLLSTSTTTAAKPIAITQKPPAAQKVAQVNESSQNPETQRAFSVMWCKVNQIL